MLRPGRITQVADTSAEHQFSSPSRPQSQLPLPPYPPAPWPVSWPRFPGTDSSSVFGLVADELRRGSLFVSYHRFIERFLQYFIMEVNLSVQIFVSLDSWKHQNGIKMSEFHFIIVEVAHRLNKVNLRSSLFKIRSFQCNKHYKLF